MEFKYVAQSVSGEAIRGVMEADSLERAEELLQLLEWAAPLELLVDLPVPGILRRLVPDLDPDRLRIGTRRRRHRGGSEHAGDRECQERSHDHVRHFTSFHGEMRSSIHVAPLHLRDGGPETPPAITLGGK